LIRRKGRGEVADRDVPKYQDFRSANSSPGCGPSCYLVRKPRSDCSTTGAAFQSTDGERTVWVLGPFGTSQH
jgi:hypothetical protein